MKSLLISIVKTVLLFAVCSNLFAGDDSGREHDAVLEYSENILEIRNDFSATYKVKERICIFNSHGNAYGVIKISDDPEFKLKKFSGRIIDAEGKEIEKKSYSDCDIVCGFSGYVFYSDNCERTYYLLDDNFPYTIEYEYEYQIKSLSSWPAWYPQKYIPVEKSSYTIIAPTGFSFKEQITGDLEKPIVTENKKHTMYVYTALDMPPLKSESFVYSRYEQRARIRFIPSEYSFFGLHFSTDSWVSLSRDGYHLVKDRYLLNDSQKTIIGSLTVPDQNTPEEIINGLHDILRQNIRYVAIEVGIGGWQPTVSCSTLERGYGDCKDLATLYISMLRYANIKSYPALIMAKGKSLTDSGYPSMFFNHMVFFSIIDGDTVWADPTCSHCAMGDLPETDEDIYVLVLDSAGGGLVKTPASTPGDNVYYRTVNISAGRKKELYVKYDVYASGNAMYDIRGYLNYRGKAAIENFLKEGDCGVNGKLKYTDVKVIETEDTRVPDTIIATGIIKRAVKYIKGKQYLSLNCLNVLRPREQIRLADRTMPLDLSYPFSYCDSVVVAIPSGWKPDKLPEPVLYEDDFGGISINFSLHNETIIICCTRKCNNYYIETEQMPAFREHLANIKKSLKSHLSFSKN
ncbi:MAG: DUF3857 domain-containing transglutaminase family protein [candidate division Zixibacteria bacterium]|nr:DUF3857 domain-containing transglutaminase family protein [candidate division Zixibacteria bacterium]